MAQHASIIQNKKGTEFWIHLAANSGNIIVAGNDSVSNVALTNEELTGCVIRKVAWGTSGNTGQYWKVARGANTVLVLDSSGTIDFQALGTNLGVYPAANLVITLNGGDNGFLMLKCKKQPESIQTAYDVR